MGFRDLIYVIGFFLIVGVIVVALPYFLAGLAALLVLGLFFAGLTEFLEWRGRK